MAHCLIYLRGIGRLMAAQEGFGGDNLAGLAIGTLRNLQLNPRLLDCALMLSTETFDGGDALTG